MSDLALRRRLLVLLEGDDELYRQLCDSGFVPVADEDLTLEHLDMARVAQVLMVELEVNWPGVEVALRLRSELVATRRQVFELLSKLREASKQD